MALQIGWEGGGGGEDRSETRNDGTALEVENLPSSLPIHIRFWFFTAALIQLVCKSDRDASTDVNVEQPALGGFFRGISETDAVPEAVSK